MRKVRLLAKVIYSRHNCNPFPSESILYIYVYTHMSKSGNLKDGRVGSLEGR